VWVWVGAIRYTGVEGVAAPKKVPGGNSEFGGPSPPHPCGQIVAGWQLSYEPGM